MIPANGAQKDLLRHVRNRVILYAYSEFHLRFSPFHRGQIIIFYTRPRLTHSIYHIPLPTRLTASI